MFKRLSTLNPGDVMAKKVHSKYFQLYSKHFFTEDTIKGTYFGF